MMRLGRGGGLLGALFLGGCAALGGPRPPVLPADGDPAGQAREIARGARPAQVLYLGEQHDNPHHHAHQRETLEALLAEGRRPALAFEMLDQGQQAEVTAALGAPQEALEARLGWRARGWPDFGMYWPLFALAARHGLGVLALDLEPALTRRISREGLAALGPEGTGLASLLPPDPEREARIAHGIREAHCGVLAEERLPRMLEAWHARNVAMARRLARGLEGSPPTGTPIVVIIGRGHLEPGGLPAQLASLRPGTRQFVVDMREVPAGVEAAEGVDVVWLTPPAERPDYCERLRRSPGPLR